MESNCSQGGSVGGNERPSCGGFDFQGSTRDLGPNGLNQHQNQNQHHSVSRQDSGIPFTMVASHACAHNLPMAEYNNGERGKNSASEDDGDGHNESNNSKKHTPWQRVKWMDKMVKLMITAVSYLGEDLGLDDKHGKKGKWRSVSKVMDERGYHVSPQQCEDKFNDLNKRYKKLNEMLGRGTSCEVVENPALLDKIDYLSEKEKDQVRKIMSSKHLFYEEMCSYHNGNRLHLPHDPALQRSLHLTLRSRDDPDNDERGKHQNEHLHDEDKHVKGDDYEEEQQHFSRKACKGIPHGALGGPSKRLRRSQSHEDFGHPNHMSSQECRKGYVPPPPRMSVDSRKAASLRKQWIESKSLELEERKLQIQAELMELERQRIKWERFSKKRDQKLGKMRMENERMKLVNGKITLELKRVELGIGLS